MYAITNPTAGHLFHKQQINGLQPTNYQYLNYNIKDFKNIPEIKKASH